MKSVNITGTDIAWVMFVVVLFGLGTIALTKPSTIKEPDAVAQAHQASMQEQLLTTTPGDLAVMSDGFVVVLGAGGRPGVVYGNEIYYMTANFGGHSQFLDVFAKNVRSVVKVGSLEHGGYASCYVLKRPAIVVNNTPMCQ